METVRCKPSQDLAASLAARHKDTPTGLARLFPWGVKASSSTYSGKYGGVCDPSAYYFSGRDILTASREIQVDEDNPQRYHM